MAMVSQAKHEADLKERLRAKHHRIMRFRKRFSEIFGVDVKAFYKDVVTGFDQFAFDDWLITQDEQYRKANAGELGEDVDCSMETHLRTKYGEEAMQLVRSFI